MSTAESDLWNLIPGGRQVDPAALTSAIVRQIDLGDLDFRTRLLIRDSLDALAAYWGEERLDRWIAGTSDEQSIRRIWSEDLGQPGFPSLMKRVTQPTTADTILKFLRDLGGRLRTPAGLQIRGSTALILPGLLSRMTEDIDVVDELPAAIRNEHALLADLSTEYGIALTHFQSHYIPDGWQLRLKSLGPFRDLEVFLLDPYDVCLSKLFSSRSKDLSDLRHLGSQLEKDTFRQRLLSSGNRLRGEEKLRKAAEHNWYVLHGEPLP